MKNSLRLLCLALSMVALSTQGAPADKSTSGSSSSAGSNSGSKSAPGKADSKGAPGKADSKAAPGKTDSKAAPGKTDSKAAPGKTDSKAAPGKTDSKAAPESRTTERKGGRTDSPMTASERAAFAERNGKLVYDGPGYGHYEKTGALFVEIGDGRRGEGRTGAGPLGRGPDGKDASTSDRRWDRQTQSRGGLPIEGNSGTGPSLQASKQIEDAATARYLELMGNAITRYMERKASDRDVSSAFSVLRGSFLRVEQLVSIRDSASQRHAGFTNARQLYTTVGLQYVAGALQKPRQEKVENGLSTLENTGEVVEKIPRELFNSWSGAAGVVGSALRGAGKAARLYSAAQDGVTGGLAAGLALSFYGEENERQTFVAAQGVLDNVVANRKQQWNRFNVLVNNNKKARAEERRAFEALKQLSTEPEPAK
jgi:hypothetical protein